MFGIYDGRAFLHDLYERYNVDTVDIDGIVAMQFLPWFKTYVSFCLSNLYT